MDNGEDLNRQLEHVARNKKIRPILRRCARREYRGQIGTLLLRSARNSKTVRHELVRTLLIPEHFFPPQPHVPTSHLVHAIWVASLAPSTLGKIPEAVPRWHRAREILEHALRSQCLYKLPLTTRDVTRTREILECLVPHHRLDPATEADFKSLELKFTSRAIPTRWLRKTLKSQAGDAGRRRFRGNRITERSQRIVTAIKILEVCGERNVKRKVANYLSDAGVRMRPFDLQRLADAYARASLAGRRDAFIRPEALPEFWLERLGWFLMYVAGRAHLNPPQGQTKLAKGAFGPI